MRTGRMCVLPSKRPKAWTSLISVIRKKTGLRRIARRGGQAQMRERRARNNASARCTLHEALLQQIGLDDFLDGVARFAERRRNGFDADRASAKGFGDQLQIALVEGIESARIDFETGERRIRNLRIDTRMFGDGGKIAHAF